ncbi:MAG: AAA family ATPase [Patescibacteria group bacterium]|jgi:dephospho-CoA kinase
MINEKLKMKNNVIIGVVGQIAAGKGVLVNYLTSQLCFTSYSLSSIVHEELKKKGIQKFTRQTLQDLGDELRRGYGDEVLARRLFEAIKEQKKTSIVIEGIRNPAEIVFLKKNHSFILIGVKANRELRFKRLLSRGKQWDPKTYEDFLKIDRRDIGVGQYKSGQQVGKCLDYCDYTLTNNKDLKDFESKIEKLFVHKLFPSQFVGK